MSRARARIAASVAVAALLATACLGGSPGPHPLEVTAVFRTTSNLFEGSEVRVLGLQVGNVEEIEPLGDVVRVSMTVSAERDYPADTTAALKPVSLLGERFVELQPYTTGPTLRDGAEIPLERTTQPAEVDEVLRSFENFLASLDANVLAELIDTTAETLEGNGEGLNELIDQGADTVRVLSDASVDLNALVGELGGLNETLATREERIGSTLSNLSTAVRNAVEDRELIVGALAGLQRATDELQPLLVEHDDPLVRDLEVLATTLGTVDRNLERVGTMFFGAQRLFTAAGRAFEYPQARIKLDNEFGPLTQALEIRLVQRLVGVCLRLGIAECSTDEFFAPLLPDLCLPGLLCNEGQATFAEAAAVGLRAMPPEAAEALVAEAEARAAAPPAEEPAAAPAPPPAPPEVPDAGGGSTPLLMPLPDPRLQESQGSGSAAPPALPVEEGSG